MVYSLLADLPIRNRTKKNKHLDIQATPNITQADDKATSSQTAQGFFSTLSIPFILQLGFMVAVASFVMHVQVRRKLWPLLSFEILTCIMSLLKEISWF